MNMSCSDLKTERQWRAVIGMNEARFIQRLKVFKTCYISYYGSIGRDLKELKIMSINEPSNHFIMDFF